MPRHKTEVVSTPTQKKVMGTSGKKYIIEVNFNRCTKTKSIPIPTLESNPIRPPTPQPNKFHSYTQIKSCSIPHTEIKSIPATKQQREIDPHTKNKSFPARTQKPHFEHALKPNTFRPANKKEVNFEARTKNN